jgi:hypothetical protein
MYNETLMGECICCCCGAAVLSATPPHLYQHSQPASLDILQLALPALPAAVHPSFSHASWFLDAVLTPCLLCQRRYCCLHT